MNKSDTINKIIEIKANQWSERTALQFLSLGQVYNYSYADLLREFKSGAERVKKSGIEAGDRVILISENRPEWVVAYLAVLEAKATVVLLDPLLPPKDLAQLIEKSDPRLLILSPAVWEKLPFEAMLGLPVLNLENKFISFAGTPEHIPSVFPPTPDPDQIGRAHV